MKRWLCLLLAAVLLAGTCIISAAEDEDDSVIVPMDADEPADAEGDEDESVIIPVDMGDETEVESVTEPARVMQYGDSGDDVLFLQIRLNDLKYYNGDMTGNYGDATRDAVRKFQADFSLEETGTADLQTQMVLFSAQYRPLRYGSTGDDVKELQTQLTALGYYKGQIKGNFLDATRKAVERFQRNNSLPVTGIADPDTQEVLFSERAI